MLDDYVDVCEKTFAALGVHFTDEQTGRLRSVLANQLTEAFTASPRSQIVITYDAPVGSTLNYHVKAQWKSIEDQYAEWVDTREGPLFGSEPDARVLALANATALPRECPVLDIGAGTGRNALPLARRGHPVDAIELTPRFADVLQAEASRESVDLTVIVGDALAMRENLRNDYGLIVASEVATDFRTDAQLRRLLHLANARLAPHGHLVMNAFVARRDFDPDDAVRQFGQQVYSSVFTVDELSAAAAGLDLTLVSDDDALDFERSNLPEEAWPPTSWYEGWASGRDIFSPTIEVSPIELRWLVYRKDGQEMMLAPMRADDSDN